jgi:hypothetical protein
MEKLLSKQHKTKGGDHATNLISQRTKNIFLAVKGTKIFLPTHGKQLHYSTLFRMYYLSQPVTGLLNKTSQLFSGRVIKNPDSSSSLTEF